MAATFSSWNSYWAFTQTVRFQSRFFQDRRVQAFLRAVTTSAEKRCSVLSIKKALWRAQLGHALEERTLDDVTYDEPVPFEAARMKPLRHSAYEGRVNPRDAVPLRRQRQRNGSG